jgi:hypothetical protein
MGVFTEISEELEGRKHVFVAVWATRVVVMMVMVMVTRSSRDCLTGGGQWECALYRGVWSDCCFLGVITVSTFSTSGKTNIHRTWRYVRAPQDATHSGIRRSQGHGCLYSARGTWRGTHRKVIVRLQCDDAIFDAIALHVSITVDNNVCIRV